MPQVAGGVLDDEAAGGVEADADKAVAAAVDFADASPEPDVATLFDHVYATPVPGLCRGLPGDPVAVPGGAGPATGRRPA